MDSAPELARHVRDAYADDARALDAVADAIEETTRTAGWSNLVDLLEAEFAVLDAKLERPDVIADHVELARIIGRKSGLRAMQELAREVLKRRDAVLADQQAKADEAARAA